jgi:DUF438 domain-containing protein
MSDSIERTRRQETLRGLIRELHAGRSVAEVKGAFAELVRGIGPAEIAELEQNLIAEGLPESEVKRLCDVHVAVFRESLDARAAARPETVPGHPVHTFLAENAACGPVLATLVKSVEAIKADSSLDSLAHAREALAHLRQYEKHYLRKENLLFPYLEKHGFSGPSSVMWAIHDDVRAAWKELDALLLAGPQGDPAGFGDRAEEIASLLRSTIQEMFYKEENILFPTALQNLSHQEWVEIRQGEAEIGYSYVEPGDRWLPVTAVHTEAGDLLSLPDAHPAPNAELELQTGSLTPDQVDLILGHLPVEITFVDEHDRVRYFSQGEEALFPRSPAVIGRQVQNCHPPASVDKVQRILDDFRAGRRDVAEFWIRMRGMLIYIRYFAVRDQDGTYRGTMEVTQEITRIQSLEGERRLLDEA